MGCRSRIVSRFRSWSDLAASPDTNFGIEGHERPHESGVPLNTKFAIALAAPACEFRVRDTNGLAHLPLRTRLAMVMYLRPESWAAATASVKGHSSRTLASLTSMGRLMPART